MTNEFRTFDERVKLYDRVAQSHPSKKEPEMIESHVRCPKPEKIKIDSQLYPPGSAFYHLPSARILALVQDVRRTNYYLLVTLNNSVAPHQNFTGEIIRGSRDDGLLQHELDPYITECKPIEHLAITVVDAK